MEIKQWTEWIFGALGVGGLLYALYIVQKSRFASTWPTVEGEMLDSDFEITKDPDGDRYEPKALYRYIVRSVTYQCDRVGYGVLPWNSKWMNEDAWQEIIRMGPRVIVRYNPRNPQDATLLCGIRRFHVATILFWCLWIGVVFSAD